MSKHPSFPSRNIFIFTLFTLLTGFALPVAAAAEARVSEAYGKLPLHFEANRGQTNEDVRFLARGPGYSLYLTASEAVMVLAKPNADVRRNAHRAPERLNTQTRAKPVVVRMSVVGAAPKPLVSGLEELPGKANYFIGKDPAKWRTNVPTYAKVHYREVYPGIDLLYYGNQRQLEYDFVVAPGADPEKIVLGFEGAERLEIDAEGELVLHVAGGLIRQRVPVIYQEFDGVRTEIEGGYVLKGANRVGFEVAAYDQSRPLVIDPTLVYSTYLGGSAVDQGQGIAVDAAGAAYVTGLTQSTDFTAGCTGPCTAMDATLGGSLDAFVTKLDPTGSMLVYSTYLGGSGTDIGFGIAVDAAGAAYVTGLTNSADFTASCVAPCTVLDATPGGATDAFVTKLDPTGSALLYSTYLGGSGTDNGSGIAVDAAGAAYVTGSTQSADFTAGCTLPCTVLDPTRGGGVDAFVTKLNPTGSALLYSTYLGGSTNDHGLGIAVDAAGAAYVTGETDSADFTAGCTGLCTVLDPTLGGSFDAFVTKLNPTGSALLYSTYLGGSDFDQGLGIAVDAAGAAYVTGQTSSADFTAGCTAPCTVLDATLNGVSDAFVTKLDPTGSALVYSTYLGGSGFDDGRGIAVDTAGAAYVTGITQSSNFTAGCTAPCTVLDATLDGGQDAFVTKLNATGTALVYSTYLGGSGGDAGVGIAVDAAAAAYVTGGTTSADFTAGCTAPCTVLDSTPPGGSQDAFVTKIADILAPPAPTPGKVSLGGFIDSAGNIVDGSVLLLQRGPVPGGKATFGGNVQFQSGDPSPTGNVRYFDHVTGDDIRASSFTTLVIGTGPCGPDTHALIIGKATVNGMPDQDVQINVDDCGEPGASGPDMLMIMTGPSQVYLNGGPLVAGNIQVRKAQ